MLTLTKAQRRALKAVYDRTTVWAKDRLHTTCDGAYGVGNPLSYREFRKRVLPYHDRSGAVIVHWAGMWVGIERDGYTHT